MRKVPTRFYHSFRVLETYSVGAHLSRDSSLSMRVERSSFCCLDAVRTWHTRDEASGPANSPVALGGVGTVNINIPTTSMAHVSKLTAT